MQDYKEVYNSFWKEIIENEDGTLNKDQIMRELADFYQTIDNVRQVYSTLTNNTTHNPLVDPSVILTLNDEAMQDHAKDTLIEASDDIDEMITDHIEFAHREFSELTDKSHFDNGYVTGAIDSLSKLKELLSEYFGEQCGQVIRPMSQH